MKELSSKLDTTVRLGKTFFIWAAGYLLLFIKLIIRLAKKIWLWLDKPHTIRIKKKTIIIGLLILCLLYATFLPKPDHIVYAGPKPSTPVNPLMPKPIKKIATMPQTDLQPVSQVEAVQAAPTPTPAPNTQSSTNNIANSVVPGCGDNAYANYIYMHESSCSTTITNYLGCLGIGQACPGSKLYAVCPNLDYACENNFFTAYANAAYGGWYNAYLAWLSKHWW